MKTAKQVLDEMNAKYASLIEEDAPLCHFSDSLLDSLACDAGYASIKQVGNENGSWNTPVREVAKDLVSCAAQLEAERLGLGRWDSLDEFFAAAQ